MPPQVKAEPRRRLKTGWYCTDGKELYRVTDLLNDGELVLVEDCRTLDIHCFEAQVVGKMREVVTADA